jgi:hypothetical protein
VRRAAALESFGRRAGICLQRSKNDQFRVLKVIHPQGLS